MSGIRMIIYLASAVIGVVLIVLLVVHLTKNPPSHAAGGTGGTPTGSSSAPAATASTAKYVFSTPATIDGTYHLNPTATTDFSQSGQTRAALVVQKIKAQGAGSPGKSVFAVYGLNTEPESSPLFKAAEFVGYDGTFDPAKVITYEKTQLASTTTVSPGPHGGQMMCGEDTSSGSDNTACLWVTTTTFGEVDFVAGQSLTKFTGNASVIALDIRNAVEIAAH
jgi:hypothetical protein